MTFEKLKEINMEISSQDLIKNGWKVIKEFKHEDGKRKYVLLKCIYCGKEKLMSYYTFKNSNIRHCGLCNGVLANALVGKIIGNFRILSIDHIENRLYSKYKTPHTYIYYNVQCTKCGTKLIRMYNRTQWEKGKYCKNCPESHVTSDPALNHLWRIYTGGAKSRNIEWKLSVSDFLNLVKKDCYYCGANPVQRSVTVHNKSKKFETAVNGIDRIDSKKPYVLENCVPCCTKCNYMKQDMPQEDFINHIKNIYKHLY